MQNAHVTWSFGSGFPQRRTRSGRFSLVSHEFSDPRSWQPRGHGQFAGNQGRRGEGSGGRPIAQKPRRPVRQASVSSSRRKRRAQGAGRTSQARMSDRCRPRVTGAGPALPDSEPGRSRSPSPPSHPQHGPARWAGQGGGPPLSRPLSHPLTRSAVPSRPRGRSPEADVSTERRFTVPHGAPLGGGAGTWQPNPVPGRTARGRQDALPPHPTPCFPDGSGVIPVSQAGKLRLGLSLSLKESNQSGARGPEPHTPTSGRSEPPSWTQTLHVGPRGSAAPAAPPSCTWGNRSRQDIPPLSPTDLRPWRAERPPVRFPVHSSWNEKLNESASEGMPPWAGLSPPEAPPRLAHSRGAAPFL